MIFDVGRAVVRAVPGRPRAPDREQQQAPGQHRVRRDRRAWPRRRARRPDHRADHAVGRRGLLPVLRGGRWSSISKREPAPERPEVRASIRQSLAEGFRAVYGHQAAAHPARPVGDAQPGLRHGLDDLHGLRGPGAAASARTSSASRSARWPPGALCGSLLAARIVAPARAAETLTLAIVGVCASPLLLLIPRDAGAGSLALAMAAWLGHGFGIVGVERQHDHAAPGPHADDGARPDERDLPDGALRRAAGREPSSAGLLGSAVGLRHAMVISVLALTTPMLWLAFSPVFRLKEMPAGRRNARPSQHATEETA